MASAPVVLTPDEHYQRSARHLDVAFDERLQGGVDVAVNYLGAVAESLQGLLSCQLHRSEGF